ncbi:MAG: hypothetical protein JNM22_16235, partial [Saprospiraceae bacterium]|nr:hypothetical protein [Saprospiraceae bacterium]
MNFIQSIACTFCVLAIFPMTAQTPVQEGPANSEAEYRQQYEERIKKDKLNGVYIPKNLD